MKYELPKEPPVGSKLLCTDFDGSQHIYVSWGVPKRNESDVTVGRRYLREGETIGYDSGCSWSALLRDFETVEDYVDEDAEFRKELASIACGFDISILNSKNRKIIEDGMKLIIQMVRDYDAKKGESK